MANDSRNNQRRERLLAGALAVLLGAVLLTSHAVSGAMAKYTTAGSSSDEARVALFGHSESIDFTQTFRTSLVQGATTSFGLTVSNANNGQVSEVAQSYEVQIVTAGNLPLHYQLILKDGNGKSDDKVIGEFDEKTSAFHTFTVTDDSMTFQPGVSRTDKYQVKVTWPGPEIEAKWSNIPDFLQVNINVKQID